MTATRGGRRLVAVARRGCRRNLYVGGGREKLDQYLEERYGVGGGILYGRPRRGLVKHRQ